jgi:hypothetical protein|eukprot:COSAG06_NODE_1376_length_9648_cov_67.818096_9_plen_77_part_00
MLALVDRCCDVTGYQIRPGLSGGGGGHSLTWGYEHRGQMAFLSEMWSIEKVREKRFFSTHFSDINDHFAKTGSGQT